eukprot:1429553-Amphidinium_carterae.2
MVHEPNLQHRPDLIPSCCAADTTSSVCSHSVFSTTHCFGGSSERGAKGWRGALCKETCPQNLSTNPKAKRPGSMTSTFTCCIGQLAERPKARRAEYSYHDRYVKSGR